MGLTVLGTGSCLPKRVVHNDEMATWVDTNDEWIASHSGISSRHVLEDEDFNDLILRAARNALDMAGVKASELDLIILSGMTGECAVPSAACTLQANLGATCPAFDLNAACSGFLYTVHVARQFFLSGAAKRILVIGAEALSRITNWSDRRTCVLFGDGVGAAVLGDGEGQIPYSSITTQGDDKGVLVCAGLGKESIPGVVRRIKESTIFMDGRATYEFATRVIPMEIDKLCQTLGWSVDSVQTYIAHQANARILQMAARKMGVPMDKFPLNIQRTGNTSCASVPILLDEVNRAGLLHKGQRIVLVAFGGGLTSGVAALEW